MFGLTYPFGLMRHSWDGCGATSHAKLLNCMRVLFGFLTVHLHRRIRYEVYGPWDHLPQDSTDVAEEQPADSAPAPRVSTTAAHDGAVIDEWESDEDTPETEGAVARSMGRLLVRPNH